MRTTECNKMLWMLNTAMKSLKERCQGRHGVEWHKVRKGFVEEVFLASGMIKMNSTGKKVVGGKGTNKIKIQPYPKTALVPFITPNTVSKQR